MLRRKAAAAAALPALDAAAAAVVMKRFLQHILVQAHGQVDRMLSFDIVLASLQVLQWHFIVSGPIMQARPALC